MDAGSSAVDFDASGNGEAIMAREINQGRMWSALFEQHHSELMEVAEILLYRNGSPESILQTALAELDGRTFDKSSGQLANRCQNVRSPSAGTNPVMAASVKSTFAMMRIRRPPAIAAGCRCKVD